MERAEAAKWRRLEKLRIKQEEEKKRLEEERAKREEEERIRRAEEEAREAERLAKLKKQAEIIRAKEAERYTNTRLNTLRKAANAMFKRDEVTRVLSHTNLYVVRGTLCIRSDRNLYRDIGLQKLILDLFLSYNPLWLRIGLETVYNESISLRSNNDIVGLTRFFSDPRLTKMSGYHKTDL